MPLAPGTRLDHYEIAGPLGAGGMGEVYRAHDARLRREVAIKILPPHFAADPGRLARFEREAQVLAALNHPNIAAIYGLENAEGIRFLVLELVEGPTLAERIASGPISLEEALRIAGQIAEALAAAHDKGIVHRDLKPANVKIAPDGTVKVLDFGLAAVVQPQMSESSDPSNSPTITMGGTQAGVILGTAPYMSPEQARGSTVDKRADIWGFGVVLYEMVAGQRLFRGDTISDTLASVLKEQPDLNRVPVKVRRLLESCLEKDPRKRLRDIADWRLPLASESPDPSRDNDGAVTSTRVGWIAAACLLLALAALAFLYFREKPPAKEMVRFEIPSPPGATAGIFPTVSPDGRRIAFVAPGPDRKAMIWVRSLDAEDARPLAGTEDAREPFWSPDSRSIAFGAGGKLKRIDAAGGPVQNLCDAASFNGGVWTADNRILFGSLGPLQIVAAAGGMPKPVTALDSSRKELDHEGPAMLPDGHHFLYTRFSIPFENGGVYIGSLDAEPEKQSVKKLLPDTTSAVYVPSPGTRDTAGDIPGYLLFLRGVTLSTQDGTLMAQPFDPKRMDFTGDAVPIAEHAGFFSVSPTGVLAFDTGGAQANGQLTWYDRKGIIQSTVGDVGEYGPLALSPDLSRAIFSRGSDLWIFRFSQGGLSSKFTIGNPAFGPVWSPDNSSITFGSIRGNGWGLYREASNMSGQEELLYQSPDVKLPTSWTHTGKFLMYDDISSDGKGTDIWLLQMEGSAADRKPIPFLRTEFNEASAQVSPDGRWVLFASDRSTRFEVYVLPFDESNPTASASGSLRQISKDGGGSARWTKDGKEITYRAADGYLMSVEISFVGGEIQIGKTQQLFKPPSGPGDVTRDGTRFLIAAPSSSGAAPANRPYHVVLNWTGLLKR